MAMTLKFIVFLKLHRRSAISSIVITRLTTYQQTLPYVSLGGFHLFIRPSWILHRHRLYPTENGYVCRILISAHSRSYSDMIHKRRASKIPRISADPWSLYPSYSPRFDRFISQIFPVTSVFLVIKEGAAPFLLFYV